MKRITLYILLVLFLLPQRGYPELGLSSEVWQPQKLSQEERSYFSSLYQDTWNYFRAYIEPRTGLPFDSSAKQPVTSISNISFYLAATAIAHKTGLISKSEALSRIDAAMTSLEAVEKWRGFPRPWILVRSLKPSFGNEFTYDSHLSVLIGGLIVVKNALPEMTDRIGNFMVDMRFGDLYHVHTDWLRGGYNIKHQNFSILQSWGHWYYKYFASAVRLLSFYGIMREGGIPVKHWDALIRPIQEKEGERFYVTGYEEAGFADQYLAGLFLDERYTEMGESQRNYARYQMKHAKKVNALGWGWAACEAPNGNYLAHGEMRDDIIAPHASILAAIYFPKEAYENLKSLEALGARPKVKEDAAIKENYGFRDSINWKSLEISKNYLTMSRGMIFLTLANLLHDGVVWNTFQQDELVQKGIRKLKIIQKPKKEENPEEKKEIIRLMEVRER